MRKYVLLAFVMMLGIMLGIGSFAAENQAKITVSSDKQSIDYAKRFLLYQGNVVMTWKDYLVEADEVQVYITIEETLEKIIAICNVKINQDVKMQASCQKVTYFPQDEVAIMEGEVKYQDDIGQTLEADKVTIWTLEERLQAEGNPVKSTYILSEEQIGTSGEESK